MATVAIDSLDDPRLAPYRTLKDKEIARQGGRFIAEGETVVRRLLASTLQTDSVLVAKRKLGAIAPLVGPHTPLLLADDELIERIIGFEFHSGVLACGIRPPSPPIDAVLPPAPQPVLAVVCQQITNTENLGALIRVSAAFGANVIILGQRCCDPFFRQAVRVSMGTVFSLPVVRSRDLPSDLDRLGEMGVDRWAAVLRPDAQALKSLSPPPRVAVVFGNEAQGLDEQTIQRCSKRVVIPMQLGTDSLNVAVAAAIFLYHLRGG